MLLNQAHAWFLKIAFVHTPMCVCVCVCSCAYVGVGVFVYPQGS